MDVFMFVTLIRRLVSCGFGWLAFSHSSPLGKGLVMDLVLDDGNFWIWFGMVFSPSMLVFYLFYSIKKFMVYLFLSI